jgi:hypothetical protein
MKSFFMAKAVTPRWLQELRLLPQAMKSLFTPELLFLRGPIEFSAKIVRSK